jgi:acetoin:2,6-dichlorophenolindophenol oxidoreductase subunit alpha
MELGTVLLATHELIAMCRLIFLVRCFETAVVELAELGDIPGSVHSSIGQEASAVGACAPLRSSDYMTGTHRSHAHLLAKGVPPRLLMAELMGREDGVCRGRGGSMHAAHHASGSLGASGIVASALPIAVGAALSCRMREPERVALAFLGEGASNEGAFHESLNLAAVWQLPVVFVCENNLYAVTTAARDALSTERVASRATSYGIPGDSVDGQDPVAVAQAVSRAVVRARAGGGPSLVECLTYRFGEHTERLPMGSYRDEGEVARWKERDPVTTFPARLVREGHLDEASQQAMWEAAKAEVDAAVEFARASPFPKASSRANYLFASAP